MSIGNPTAEAPSLARIGHVNLSVSDLGRSLAFYRDHVGMSVTKLLDEAAFLSLGGYHHDLCINTWRSKEGAPGPKGATGLYHFAITYGDLGALQAVVQHVRSAGIPIEDVVDHGVSLSVYVRDPDQNGVELTWDRPAETWWSEDGSLRMGHRRIALEELLVASRRQEPWER